METIQWDQLIKQSESAGSGDPLPKSDYTVCVASAEAKMSSTGKPMLKVKAKVVGGPFDGRVLWNNLTLSKENDTAVSIFMRHLAAFGLDNTYFARNPSFEQVAIDLVGKYAIFSVSVGTYKGKQKNDVDDVKPVSVAPGVADPSSIGPAPQVPQPPVPPAPAPLPQVPVPMPVPDVPQSPTIPVPPAPAPAPEPPAPAPAPQPDSTPAPPAPPF